MKLNGNVNGEVVCHKKEVKWGGNSSTFLSHRKTLQASVGAQILTELEAGLFHVPKAFDFVDCI
jgi:hypothetical protein